MPKYVFQICSIHSDEMKSKLLSYTYVLSGPSKLSFTHFFVLVYDYTLHGSH